MLVGRLEDVERDGGAVAQTHGSSSVEGPAQGGMSEETVGGRLHMAGSAPKSWWTIPGERERALLKQKAVSCPAWRGQRQNQKCSLII